MNTKNLNNLQSPNATILKHQVSPSDYVYPPYQSSQNIQNIRIHDPELKSPYFPSFQSPFNGDGLSSERIIRTTYQSSMTSQNERNQPIRRQDFDNSEIKHSGESKPIPNKYGLEVKRIGKTPRNSNPRIENQQNVSRTKPQIINTPIERGHFFQHQTEINGMQTPIKINPPIESNQSLLAKVVPFDDQLTQNRSNGIYVQKPQSTDELSTKSQTLIQVLPKPSVDIKKVETRILEMSQKGTECVRIELDGIGFYEGTIKNNQMHGYGKFTDPQNRVLYEGEIVSNHFEGLGIEYNFPTSKVNNVVSQNSQFVLPLNWIRYEGLFHNSLKCGMSYWYFDDTSYYFGEFANNAANGFGTYNYGNGECIKGIWKNNVLIERG